MPPALAAFQSSRAICCKFCFPDVLASSGGTQVRACSLGQVESPWTACGRLDHSWLAAMACAPNLNIFGMSSAILEACTIRGCCSCKRPHPRGVAQRTSQQRDARRALAALAASHQPECCRQLLSSQVSSQLFEGMPGSENISFYPAPSHDCLLTMSDAVVGYSALARGKVCSCRRGRV